MKIKIKRSFILLYDTITCCENRGCVRGASHTLWHSSLRECHYIDLIVFSHNKECHLI